MKYPTDGTDQQGGTGSYLSGVDYVKKIFQVQFTTPRIDQGDLPRFLETIAAAAELPGTQRQDLRDVVTPQVRHLAETRYRNPREVKRLVNGYTMQMKMLERKLKTSRAPPRPPPSWPCR